ncbi:MAG TPA: macro domain-containing protein [Thermoanaerobaculia bacterium]|nr:macro domain-containing protein [Thermoanaerobaculia bacterium]
MRITLFTGDITDAPAEAICTSTNARLSLMMGTGGAVRERGGFEVLRACEKIVAESGRGALPAGTAYATTAGSLPYKAAIHCIASDPKTHLSSEALIQRCVTNALARADALHCASVAMPVFATGHARFKFERAIEAMLAALRAAATQVEHVVIVVHEPRQADDVRRILAA